MPPPQRAVRPRNPMDARPTMHGGDANDGERRMSNISSSHPTIHLPDENAQGRPTALIPYCPVVGHGSPPCLRRPRRLTPEGNFAIITTVSENVRKRSKRPSQRGEARALWMRLRHPTPEGPFGPTAGFSDAAVRLAILGRTYLELAVSMDNSAARKHIQSGMLGLRDVQRNPLYMRHWRGFRNAYESYLETAKDFPILQAVSFARAGSPHREVVGGGWGEEESETTAQRMQTQEYGICKGVKVCY